MFFSGPWCSWAVNSCIRLSGWLTALFSSAGGKGIICQRALYVFVHWTLSGTAVTWAFLWIRRYRKLQFWLTVHSSPQTEICQEEKDFKQIQILGFDSAPAELSSINSFQMEAEPSLYCIFLCILKLNPINTSLGENPAWNNTSVPLPNFHSSLQSYQ